MTELLVCFMAMTGIALATIYRCYQLIKLLHSSQHRVAMFEEELRYRANRGQSDVDKSEGWMPWN